MTGNLIVAVLLAVLLEAYRWVKVRWDFDENAHVKAFQFSLLLMALWVALSWIDDQGRLGSLNVIRWLPLISFPIEFAQRYGKLDRMNLNAFFYFSRRRMNLDRKEGKEVDPIQVNTGYPYILGVLAAAGSPEGEPLLYWPLLCFFVVLVLFSVLKQRGLKWLNALWLLPLVLGMSWGLQWGMSTFYAWAKARLEFGLRSNQSGFLTDWMSHISEPGKVNLNPKIEWRVWSDQAPEYLRVASFNNYNNGRWTYNYKATGFEGLDAAYIASDPKKFIGDVGTLTYFKSEDRGLLQDLQTQDSAVIRGTVQSEQATAVVPTLAGFYAVSNMLGEDTYAEVSPMGTLRFVNREMLIDYTLWSDEDYGSQEATPYEEIDLKASDSDAETIALLAEQLELADAQNAEEVVDKIIFYFLNHFEYSTNFDNGGYDGERSKLEWFLNDLKTGHCEYFATATTLLLREAGIPARYCVGYSGVERGRGCWNVRGTNAHAWTRAYIDGKWVDVDATPPDWRGVSEGDALDPVEWLREQINLLREDFFMWRNNPENRNALIFRGSILASLLVLWIVFRLWRGRSQSTETALYASRWEGETVQTPLLSLEKTAQKHLGKRKRGEPLGAWIGKLAEIESIDAELVRRAVELHQSLRFDQQGDNGELKDLVKELKKQLRKL